MLTQPLVHRTAPGSEGLAGSGRGVHQTTLAALIRGPDVTLKGERLPPARREPLVDRHSVRVPMSARKVAIVSASSGRLSVRQRRMRGKRTATPDLWRGDG